MRDDLLIATNDAGKAGRIRKLFVETGMRLFSMPEAGLAGSFPVLTGTTLEARALEKARRVGARYKREIWIMSDDTGLFIPALGNEPGIRTERWARDRANPAENARHCLEQMAAVKDRRARFETAIVLVSPDGAVMLYSHSVWGRLLKQPRVSQMNLSYSDLFVLKGQKKTLAEMTTTEKNRLSHRGQALRKAREFLLLQSS